MTTALFLAFLTFCCSIVYFEQLPDASQIRCGKGEPTGPIAGQAKYLDTMAASKVISDENIDTLASSSASSGVIREDFQQRVAGECDKMYDQSRKEVSIKSNCEKANRCLCNQSEAGEVDEEKTVQNGFMLRRHCANSEGKQCDVSPQRNAAQSPFGKLDSPTLDFADQDPSERLL